VESAHTDLCIDVPHGESETVTTPRNLFEDGCLLPHLIAFFYTMSHVMAGVLFCADHHESNEISMILYKVVELNIIMFDYVTNNHARRAFDSESKQSDMFCSIDELPTRQRWN